MSFFFFSSRRRHTRYIGDWSSDVCSSDLVGQNCAAGTSRTGAEAVGQNARPAEAVGQNRGSIAEAVGQKRASGAEAVGQAAPAGDSRVIIRSLSLKAMSLLAEKELT